MPSNVSADSLRKIHRIHRQLTDLREQLERGPKQIVAREVNVKRQEELLAQAQDEAKKFRMATDAKQLLFKSKEEKVKELKIKLNAAGSNREYQALKDQIAADQMANSVLEDEILEAMEQIETHLAKVREATTALAKAKEETQRATQDIQAREPTLRGEVERLEAELKDSETSLPEDIRDVYQRMVRGRGEEALAPVIDGSFCGGCNQQVPLNLYNQLKLNRPVFCKSCGRLMYIPEGEE